MTKLNAGKNSNEFVIKTIENNTVNANKLKLGQLSAFYYLVVYMSYPKKENTWEPLSTV